MRGLYSAEYLSKLSLHYQKTRMSGPLDVGRGFDLIAASSTGAIIACALATGLPLVEVVQLYRTVGPKVFPVKLPRRVTLGSLKTLWKLPFRSKHLRAGGSALRQALDDSFGDRTIRSVWEDRQIALAIPAINMASHRAWVFKTPHLDNSRHRDDNYRLVDVCLAATAAPIYRTMERLADPDTGTSHTVFIDGGLWANNPVLVGLVDALALSAPGSRIEIYCLGTCPRPAGEFVPDDDLAKGLFGWSFGADVAVVSISAQEYAFDNMARLLARHLDREVTVARFPHGGVPAELSRYLDLDETHPHAMDALAAQADVDVSETLSRSGDGNDPIGQSINRLFREIPTVANTETMNCRNHVAAIRFDKLKGT